MVYQQGPQAATKQLDYDSQPVFFCPAGAIRIIVSPGSGTVAESHMRVCRHSFFSTSIPSEYLDCTGNRTEVTVCSLLMQKDLLFNRCAVTFIVELPVSPGQ